MNTGDHRRAYLTIPEAALELAISAPTVRRKISAGELPAIQLGGPRSAIRIRRDELEAWTRGHRLRVNS